MSPSATAEDQPLLSRVESPAGSSVASYDSTSKSSIEEDEEAPFDRSILLDRSVENDVLPETAVLGRNLGWSSAYILIMSRVIGSGIFATPGAIVQSVGSIGISLLLWVIGALIAWLGLAISLEYGCMLPRSGGERPLTLPTGDNAHSRKGRRSTLNSYTDDRGSSHPFSSQFAPCSLDSQPPTASCSANTFYTPLKESHRSLRLEVLLWAYLRPS